MTQKDFIQKLDTKQLARFLIAFNVRKAIKAMNKQWVTEEAVTEWLNSEMQQDCCNLKRGENHENR